MPNPWDAGSAKLLESLGFHALATTSSGFAATLGRLDGNVTADEAIDHAGGVVAATDVPVSADLENGFADDPAGVAATVARALGAGLAGCSVEDFTGGAATPIYDAGRAVDRVAAAAEAAHGGAGALVLTARPRTSSAAAPTWRHHRSPAGLPGGRGRRAHRARSVSASTTSAAGHVGRPSRQRARAARGPPVAELRRGRGRPHVGGVWFPLGARGVVVEAAHELREHGTYDYFTRASEGGKGVCRVLDPRELSRFVHYSARNGVRGPRIGSCRAPAPPSSSATASVRPRTCSSPTRRPSPAHTR